MLRVFLLISNCQPTTILNSDGNQEFSYLRISAIWSSRHEEKPYSGPQGF
jgi:hypothetical protein